MDYSDVEDVSITIRMFCMVCVKCTIELQAIAQKELLEVNDMSTALLTVYIDSAKQIPVSSCKSKIVFFFFSLQKDLTPSPSV